MARGKQRNPRKRPRYHAQSVDTGSEEGQDGPRRKMPKVERPSVAAIDCRRGLCFRRVALEGAHFDQGERIPSPSSCTVSLRREDEEEDATGQWLLGFDFRTAPDGDVSGTGMITLPSANVGRCFLDLLMDKHIGIQLDLSQEDGPGTSTAMNMKPFLHVSLLDSVFREAPKFADEIIRRRWHPAMKAVTDWLLPDLREPSEDEDVPEVLGSISQGKQHGFDIGVLYKEVNPVGDEPEWEGELPGLKTKLRPYQKRSVAWMVQREQVSQRKASQTAIHPLWCKVRTVTGDGEFSFNPLSGQISKKAFSQPRPVEGGILCDEMGLGKTVEVLACMVAHRCPGGCSVDGSSVEAKKEAVPPHIQEEHVDCICGATSVGNFVGCWVLCDKCKAWLHGRCIGWGSRGPETDYICPKCIMTAAETKVTTGCAATLIVCPDNLLQQWKDEIEKHVEPDVVRVLIFQGTGGGQLLSATELAAADVVITTYGTLRSELSHHWADPENNGRELRAYKRYLVWPTPLTRIRWWRICFDEVQMVEGMMTKATEMAQALSAVNRWCVSGTPLNRGLNDLYGLMALMQISPWNIRHWWNAAIQRPLEEGRKEGWHRLLSIVRPSSGGIMWRTSKASVMDQLGIPPQLNHLEELRMSAIEEHFYRSQHKECLAKMTKVWARLKEEDPTRRLTPREQQQIYMPLLRLRQACCHPQVGKNGIRALSMHNSPMTMEQILDVLVARAHGHAEESQRVLLSALNGIAAIHLLRGEKAKGVQVYRDALLMADENKNEIRVDPLQKYHILFNLAQLLSHKDGGDLQGIPRTLRDDEYAKEAEDIRSKYLLQNLAKVAAAESKFKQALEACGLVGSTHERPGGHNWWLEALSLLMRVDKPAECVETIKDKLSEHRNHGPQQSISASSICHEFMELSGLKFVVHRELDAVDRAMRDVIKRIDELSQLCTSPSKEMVQECGHCGRCRGDMGAQGIVCQYCHLDELFIKWEVRLFSLQTRAMANGVHITPEEAARQAHYASLRRVACGGLNEEAGEYEQMNDAKETRRQLDAVSDAQVIHSPSEVERVLGILPQLLRTAAALDTDDPIFKMAKEHVVNLAAQRKLFFRARAASIRQREMLYAYDELEMASGRLQLRQSWECISAHESMVKLHDYELAPRMHDFENEKAVAEADVKRNMGTIRYLHTLKSSAAKTNGKESSNLADEGPSTSSPCNEESQHKECPVCHDDIRLCCVLLCAHQLCYTCSQLLTDRVPNFVPLDRRAIRCPVCRAECPINQMAYVDTRPRAGGDADDTLSKVHLRGSYSTKIEAIVRRILWILQQSPDSRILVFSSWTDLLNILAHALKTNLVGFMCPVGKKAIASAIRTFGACDSSGGAESESSNSASVPKGMGSHTETQPRVLLLLFCRGGNGLNLTGAQHVILVEPLLDPALEAQAIGRVHRMGQTRETHVYRFVTSSTIEHNVHSLAVQRAQAMDFSSAVVSTHDAHTVTVGDVKQLLQQDQHLL